MWCNFWSIIGKLENFTIMHNFFIPIVFKSNEQTSKSKTTTTLLKNQSLGNPLADESTSSLRQPLPQRNPTSALECLDGVENNGPAERVSCLATCQNIFNLI